jgi:hypothetical protein
MKTYQNLKENFERYNLQNHFEIYIYQKEGSNFTIPIDDPRVTLISFEHDQEMKDLVPKNLEETLKKLKTKEPLKDLTMERLLRWNDQVTFLLIKSGGSKLVQNDESMA